jgi:DNA invertase Pin-like site-specific DNA recombinase
MPAPPLGPPAPRVFGYLRVPSRRPTYGLACRRRFAWYCQDWHLQVACVFIDEGPGDTAMQRPGFAELCSRISTDRPAAVLILHPRDLSADPAIARQLALQLRAAGVQLLTVRGALDLDPVGAVA